MITSSFVTEFNNNAIATANALGGLEANPNPREFAHNDQYDAYRHALMSAKLTELLRNPGLAKWATDKYEERNPNLPAEDNMDRWNNGVGRDEYSRWKQASGE